MASDALEERRMTTSVDCNVGGLRRVRRPALEHTHWTFFELVRDGSAYVCAEAIAVTEVSDGRPMHRWRESLPRATTRYSRVQPKQRLDDIDERIIRAREEQPVGDDGIACAAKSEERLSNQIDGDKRSDAVAIVPRTRVDVMRRDHSVDLPDPVPSEFDLSCGEREILHAVHGVPDRSIGAGSSLTLLLVKCPFYVDDERVFATTGLQSAVGPDRAGIFTLGRWPSLPKRLTPWPRLRCHLAAMLARQSSLSAST